MLAMGDVKDDVIDDRFAEDLLRDKVERAVAPATNERCSG
jgi:hypothetical protein